MEILPMFRTVSGRTSVTLLLLVATVLVFSACSRDNEEINPYADYGTDADSTLADREATTGEGLPDIDISDRVWSKDAGLQPVYFAYDSYTLDQQARQVLMNNADLIKQVPNDVVLIEGHCDERGTQEYNLALGSRRAEAVREYLMNLGISGDRLLTVSYGEEAPAVMGSNEAAWAKNRRCEFSRAQSR
jgi:peptidoglycan-associated lipoprotein